MPLPPLSILRMLWKRRWVIATASVLLCAISATVVYEMPPIYKAEAVILVDAQKIPEKFVSSTVSSGVSDRLAVISQQIMSTTRLLKLIHDFGLYKEGRPKSQEELIEQMRRDISVNVQKDNWATGKPVAFRVGYEGRSPVVVAAVANQLADFYIQENLQTREMEAAGTSEFIDNQLEQAKKELDDEEQKVAKFKAEHNGSLPEQENPLLSNLSNLRVQLQGIQDAINRAQQEKVMLETSISTEESLLANMQRSLQLRNNAVSGAPEVAHTTVAVTDAEGKTLLTLERTLSEMKTRYTPDYPEVLALEARIAQLKQAQREEAEREAAANAAANNAAANKDAGQGSKGAAGNAGQTTAGAAGTQVVPREIIQERGKIALMESELAALKKDLETEQVDRQQILAQIGAMQSRVDALPLVEQQMAALTRDYETSKANYKSLLDKRNEAEMSTDMERRQKSERFEILDPARVPDKPIKPLRSLWLGIGVAASLLVSFGLGLALEITRNNLLGEWELPASVPVLGRVPLIQVDAALSTRSIRMRFLAVSSVAAALLVAAAYYVLKSRY